MEKRNWLWKRKSSEKSPGGETESSGSISSHSERYSDEQEAMKGSPNNSTQSPEVTSKIVVSNEDVNENIKSLTEKLSAALVNVGAKEELVKQHAKVAEEAVAGWEKAENEGAVLKQELEVTLQQNLALEVRVSHLEGALKECVRQLRQAKDEYDQRVQESLLEKTRDLESSKNDLERQLTELRTQVESKKPEPTPMVSIDPKILSKLEFLEKENSKLKVELMTQAEELELRTIEMELSTQAAETASKQQLESIKKVARLEAECRRLQAAARKPHKPLSVSSHYVDSLADSQSESSDSQPKNLPVSPVVEIDLMDDFLEMERLAALPEITNTRSVEPEPVNPLQAELEAMRHRVAGLEAELDKIEEEKAELIISLNSSQYSLEESRVELAEVLSQVERLQKELRHVNEAKELVEFRLAGVQIEAQALSAKVASFKSEVETLNSHIVREQMLSADMTAKYEELKAELARKIKEFEDELNKKNEELKVELAKRNKEFEELNKKTDRLKVELARNNKEFNDELNRKNEEVVAIKEIAISNDETKVKQEDLVMAAGKLAECQQTIASLGRQLKSLATLEDFLIDTTSLPVFLEKESAINKTGNELWKLHSNDTFMAKLDQEISSALPVENPEPPSNQLGPTKSKNGFGKLFSRSKSGIQAEIPHV